MIQPERIKSLNNNALADYENIYYWMQSSQRTTYNQALEFAINKANELNKRLTVFFTITDDFPEANHRHYKFMLEGLQIVKKKLKEKNINFLLFYGNPVDIVQKIAENASMIITDMDYLKETRLWRKKIADKINCPLLQIESNVIVPVEEASKKEEYAAYTIRKKINKKLYKYLKAVEMNEVKKPSSDFEIFFNDYLKKREITSYLENENKISELLNKVNIDHSVKATDYFKGGEDEAEKLLYEFIRDKLDDYHNLSNNPTKDYLSHLSPYLHFGQISPLLIALEVKDKYSPGQEDFLEQLIIRRELSINFVYYTDDYKGDLKNILPEWAYESLQIHKDDPRDFIYTKEEFENAETHDKYWNAAQREMMIKGKMHGYMRMYWGKKILEWTENPQKAFEIALYLNNKYSLDGRDPNAFTGIAWLFGKHDRAWKERQVFGKTRYMNANGLNRKFAADLYVNQIDKLSLASK